MNDVVYARLNENDNAKQKFPMRKCNSRKVQHTYRYI